MAAKFGGAAKPTAAIAARTRACLARKRRFAGVVVTASTALVIACGGPFTVREGPESCRVARTFPNAFGSTLRGNIFSFQDHAVGLLSGDGPPALRSIWAVQGAVNAAVARGTRLQVAVGTEVLELEVMLDATGRAESRPIPWSGVPQRHRLVTTWDVVATVDDEALRSLGRAPTRALRLPSGVRQVDVPDAIGRRMQSLALCIAGGYPVR